MLLAHKHSNQQKGMRMKQDVVLPVEAVHHFELSPQLLLGQVVQHAGVHQGLHEVAAVLRQAQAGQPVVAHPLVIHIAVGQYLEGDDHRLSTLIHALLDVCKSVAHDSLRLVSQETKSLTKKKRKVNLTWSQLNSFSSWSAETRGERDAEVVRERGRRDQEQEMER